MQAIIGRYAVSVEKTCFICTHPTGISFDLTFEEALGLMRFLAVYEDTLLASQHLQQSSADSSPKVNIHDTMQNLDDENRDSGINP